MDLEEIKRRQALERQGIEVEEEVVDENPQPDHKRKKLLWLFGALFSIFVVILLIWFMGGSSVDVQLDDSSFLVEDDMTYSVSGVVDGADANDLLFTIDGESYNLDEVSDDGTEFSFRVFATGDESVEFVVFEDTTIVYEEMAELKYTSTGGSALEDDNLNSLFEEDTSGEEPTESEESTEDKESSEDNAEEDTTDGENEESSGEDVNDDELPVTSRGAEDEVKDPITYTKDDKEELDEVNNDINAEVEVQSILGSHELYANDQFWFDYVEALEYNGDREAVMQLSEEADELKESDDFISFLSGRARATLFSVVSAAEHWQDGDYESGIKLSIQDANGDELFNEQISRQTLEVEGESM